MNENINDGINQSPCVMRKAFLFYGITWTQFECVFGLRSEFRWTAYG